MVREEVEPVGKVIVDFVSMGIDRATASSQCPLLHLATTLVNSEGL